MSKAEQLVSHRGRAIRSWFVAGLVLASACATGEEADLLGAPIAEVALENGMTVSFYEPSPGSILISQDAPGSVQPVRTDRLTAVELYSSLVPGQPVPEDLAAAQARQDAARAGKPARREAEPRPNVGTSTTQSYIDNKTIDDAWFFNSYCGGTPDVLWCRLNRESGIWTEHSSVDEAFYAVCADVGNVTLKVFMGDELAGQWDVLEGNCRWYHWTSGIWNESTRGEVVNVHTSINDRYHYSARYWF